MGVFISIHNGQLIEGEGLGRRTCHMSVRAFFESISPSPPTGIYILDGNMFVHVHSEFCGSWRRRTYTKNEHTSVNQAHTHRHACARLSKTLLPGPFDIHVYIYYCQLFASEVLRLKPPWLVHRGASLLRSIVVDRCDRQLRRRLVVSIDERGDADVSTSDTALLLLLVSVLLEGRPPHTLCDHCSCCIIISHGVLTETSDMWRSESLKRLSSGLCYVIDVDVDHTSPPHTHLERGVHTIPPRCHDGLWSLHSGSNYPRRSRTAVRCLTTSSGTCADEKGRLPVNWKSERFLENQDEDVWRCRGNSIHLHTSGCDFAGELLLCLSRWRDELGGLIYLRLYGVASVPSCGRGHYSWVKSLDIRYKAFKCAFRLRPAHKFSCAAQQQVSREKVLPNKLYVETASIARSP